MNKSSILPDDFLPSFTESQQSRMVPSFIQNQCQCELCAFDYDLFERVPMMLCDNQHVCCLICVNQIIIRKRQCPFCRKDIDVNRIVKNRMVCKILEEMAKKQGIIPKINHNPVIKRNAAIIVPQNSYPAPFIPPPSPPPIVSNNDIEALLLPPAPNHVYRQSCCERLQCGEGLYCVAYAIAFIIITPFFITELIYAFTLDEQSCMDRDYGVGMDLRTWLLSSGLIGLSMFTLQFSAVLNKLCCPSERHSKYAKVISVLNIIFFILKFLGYNIVGIVVINNVDSTDLDNCNDSVKSYMQAILIILIISFSGICGLVDRRR